MDAPESPRAGFVAAFSAFALWGLLPLYWGLLTAIPPWEVLAHRVVWTAALCVAILLLTGQGPALARVFREPAQRRATIAASVLISTNGLIFIWAVAERRVTEVSLGYYINPLLNALLGMVVLKERPTPLQGAAIALAGIGVAILTTSGAGLPWPSLVLAGCFGLYGLVRKTAPIAPLTGLGAEMLIASPVGLAYLAFGPDRPWARFVDQSAKMQVLLLLTGAASALPLFLFAFGARRLPYTTTGILMYLAPSLQLAIAVFANGEPFDATRAVTFAFIWGAIALYLAGSFRRARAAAA